MTCCWPIGATGGSTLRRGIRLVLPGFRSLGVHETDQKFSVVDQDVLEPLIDSLTPRYFLTSGARLSLRCSSPGCCRA